MKVTLLENMGYGSRGQNRILTFLGLWPRVRRRLSSWCSWGEAPGEAGEMGCPWGGGALHCPRGASVEAFSSGRPPPVTCQYTDTSIISIRRDTGLFRPKPFGPFGSDAAR